MKTPRSLYLQMLWFYIPLAIQAASHSFAHLLVTSVVTHGTQGAAEYAAFQQGNVVMYILAALGMGLPTTAMVYGRSRAGVAAFNRLNARLMLGSNLLQVVFCLPPLDTIVFGRLLGLDGALFEIARRTLLLDIPMLMLLYTRNLYLARLLVEKRSGAANTATMVRFALGAAIAPLFVRLGLCGYFWGNVAATLPLAVDVWLTRRFALAGLRALPETSEDAPQDVTAWAQCKFTVPLSIGGFMLSLSKFMMAFFLGRLPDAATAMSIHYIGYGLVIPFTYGALRLQAVTIAFARETDGGRRAAPFAALVGLGSAALVLVAWLPPVARWYFTSVQNLGPQLVPLARNLVLVALPVALAQAMRGHAEGLAAVRHRTKAILAGQIGYLLALVGVLAALGAQSLVPGYMHGTIALCAAMAAASAVIRLALLRGGKRSPLPAGRAPEIAPQGEKQ